MIDGVVIRPLAVIPDERGKVMHMLKATDPEFERFGEIYFSTVFPGVVKGWHFHRDMTLNYAVVSGMMPNRNPTVVPRAAVCAKAKSTKMTRLLSTWMPR